MSMVFDSVKKLGFGCMRLPMIGDEVDIPQTSRMVDLFLEGGFNYFDTAHGYISGKSESAIKECLSSRYPREAYILCNKLSSPHFNREADLAPLFESQLEACGVDYFDVYLLHAMDKEKFEKYKRCRAYDFALDLKRRGLIRHLGMSFHDNAEVLDEILTEFTEIEVVQIQLNYVDWYDSAVDSKRVYEVCLKHRKPIIIMEPVKGGALANLDGEAKAIFSSLGDMSDASYAIRYAAGKPGVFMVLSGMGNMDMMLDNTSYMKEFAPLDEREAAAVERVSAILRSQNKDTIPCTGCEYCTEVCPRGVKIPIAFASLNAKGNFGGFIPSHYYQVRTADGGAASECIGCGRCEAVCPQHLEIRKLLTLAVEAFEGAEE